MTSDVNGFVRKMDILNGDLQLKNDAEAKKRGSRTKSAEDESIAGFHFIAFVPIDGKVWKLDGLERQPQNLGKNSTYLSSVVSSLLMLHFLRFYRKPRMGPPGKA